MHIFTVKGCDRHRLRSGHNPFRPHWQPQTLPLSKPSPNRNRCVGIIFGLSTESYIDKVLSRSPTLGCSCLQCFRGKSGTGKECLRRSREFRLLTPCRRHQHHPSDDVWVALHVPSCLVLP